MIFGFFSLFIVRNDFFYMIIIIEKFQKKIFWKTEFFSIFKKKLKNPFLGEVYLSFLGSTIRLALSFLGSTIRLARAVRGVNSAD